MILCQLKVKKLTVDFTRRLMVGLTPCIKCLCSTPGDIVSTMEDIMSTLRVFGSPGDTMTNVRKVIKKTTELYGNPDVLNIPLCTHDIPHTHHSISLIYSWYLSGVLNTAWCTQCIPRCTEYPQSVLNDIPMV